MRLYGALAKTHSTTGSNEFPLLAALLPDEDVAPNAGAALTIVDEDHCPRGADCLEPL
jgi:hypothetical protein